MLVRRDRVIDLEVAPVAPHARLDAGGSLVPQAAGVGDGLAHRPIREHRADLADPVATVVGTLATMLV
jgi:hypothetical protein